MPEPRQLGPKVLIEGYFGPVNPLDQCVAFYLPWSRHPRSPGMQASEGKHAGSAEAYKLPFTQIRKLLALYVGHNSSGNSGWGRYITKKG